MQNINLLYKVENIVFSSHYSVLAIQRLIYHICNIFNLCHNVFICKHQDILSYMHVTLHLKVPYGFQSICKQTCKHLVRCALHILMHMLIFSQSNS